MKDRLIELLEKANETIMGFTIDGDLEILADHLLANGVIVLPCAIGRTLYDATEFLEGRDCPDIYELKDDVMYVEKTKWGSFLFSYDGIYIDPDDIGKTVFLTKSEAEKALAERSGQ